MLDLRAIVFTCIKPFASSHLKEDLIQEAWVAVFEALEKVKEERSDAETAAYLKTCVSHKLINLSRRERHPARNAVSMDLAFQAPHSGTAKEHAGLVNWVGFGEMKVLATEEWPEQRDTLHNLVGEIGDQEDASEMQKLDRRMRRKLSDKAYRIVRMKCDGMNFAQIGAWLGMEEDATRKAYSRAVETVSYA